MNHRHLLIAILVVCVVGSVAFIYGASQHRIGRFRDEIVALSESGNRIRISDAQTGLIMPFDEAMLAHMSQEMHEYSIKDFWRGTEARPTLLIVENANTVAAYYQGGYLTFPEIGHRTIARITGTRLGDYLHGIEAGAGR